MSAAAIARAGPRARTGRRPSWRGSTARGVWSRHPWRLPGRARLGRDAGPAGRGVRRGPSGACAGHALPGPGRRPAAGPARRRGAGRARRRGVLTSCRAGRRAGTGGLGDLRCVALRSGPQRKLRPDGAGPGRLPPLALPRRLAEFARHLEIRPATTARPLAGGEQAELVAWMRFRDDRPLDAEAATVLTDACRRRCWPPGRPRGRCPPPS